MSVTATYLGDLSRVRITCAAAPAHADFAKIERSVDGITWSVIRGGDTVSLVSGGCTIDDYEFTAGVLNTYRATYVDSAVPSFVAVGSGPTGNNTSLNPTLPAGLVDGDMLVLFASIRATGAAVSTPTGWSLYVDGGNVRVFVRVYDATVTAPTVNFTGGAAGDDTIAQIAAVRNADAGSAAWLFQTNASAQDINLPALSIPATPSFFALGVGWKQDVSTSSSAPAGWTVITRISSSSGTGATQIWHWLQPTANIPARTVGLAGGAAAISEGATLRVPQAPYVSRETQTITPTLTSVWLKNPQRPYLNRAVTVTDWTDVERPARTGVFDVVGRSFPVGVTELRGSRRYTLTITTTTLAAATDIDGCLSAGEPVLIHTPAGCPVPGMYAVVGDTAESRRSKRTLRRYFTLPLTEVAAPAGTLIGATVTWQGVINAFATWEALIAAEPTWSDLLDRIGTPGDVQVP